MKLIFLTMMFLKVKNDHRSKFSNLRNWKEEALIFSGFFFPIAIGLSGLGSRLCAIIYLKVYA